MIFTKFKPKLLAIVILFFSLNITAMEEDQNKKLKLYEINIKPKTYHPESLVSWAATVFIDDFLNTPNEEEREEFKNCYSDLCPESEISNYLHEHKIKEQTLISRYNELPEEVREIITQKVNSPITQTGETLLHQAQTPHEVTKLLFLGAKTERYSALQQDPFTATLAQGNVEAARKILESMKEDEEFGEVFDTMSFSIFQYAIIADAVDIVTKLLDNPSVDYSYSSYPKVSPLLLAATYSAQSVNRILDKDADVVVQNTGNDDVNAFLLASAFQSKGTLKIIANHTPQIIKSCDINNQNALFYAALSGNSQVISYLVKNLKLDPNSTNNMNQTPLTIAQCHLTDGRQYLATLFELLKYGAKPNASVAGFYVAYLSHFYDHREFVRQYSELCGANYICSHHSRLPIQENTIFYPLASVIFSKAQNANGSSTYGPIHEKLDLEIIKFLIEKGAKITQEHKDKITDSDSSLFSLIKNVPAFTDEELTSYKGRL